MDRKPPPPEPLWTRFPVRYHESDQMGVVHHAVFVTWFEAARVHAMRCLGIDYAELERSGSLLAVAAVEVRYLAPARFGEEVRVDSWAAEIERVRVRVEYRVSRCLENREHPVICTGSTLLAHVDRDLRPRRFPPELRLALERWTPSSALEDS